MKKIISALLLFLFVVALFATESNDPCTTITLPDQASVSFQADSIVYDTETNELTLTGNVRVNTQNIEIQAEALTFTAEEQSSSVFPVSGDAPRIEAKDQNQLPIKWSADSSTFYTHAREVLLEGNVIVDLGFVTASAENVRIIVD